MSDVLYSYMKRCLIDARGGRPESKERTSEILLRDDIFI